MLHYRSEGALPFFPFLLQSFPLPPPYLSSPRPSKSFPAAPPLYSPIVLRLAISDLGEVTGGEITSEAVLHRIFAHFCIGK